MPLDREELVEQCIEHGRLSGLKVYVLGNYARVVTRQDLTDAVVGVLLHPSADVHKIGDIFSMCLQDRVEQFRRDLRKVI